MRDNQCVGFFTLHEGQGVKPYSDNNKAIFSVHLVWMHDIVVKVLEKQ